MDQYLSIRAVRAMLRRAIETADNLSTVEQLRVIDDRLAVFHDAGIDFKEVVDSLDNSILITDGQGIVLYINPAYTRNTGITEEDVLGKKIQSLIGPDKLFTGGAVCSVLQSKKVPSVCPPPTRPVPPWWAMCSAPPYSGRMGN